MTETVEGEFRVFRTPGEFPTRIPVKEAVPLLRDDDPESKKLQIVADGRAAMFVMNNDADAKSCQAIAEKVAKGEAAIQREEITWSEALQSYVVYMRWNEIYQEMAQKSGESNDFRT